MPRVKIVIWIVLFIIALWACLFNTRVETEFSLFLPRSASLQERFLVNQLRQGPGSQLVIISIEGADAKTLAGISSRLGKQLRGSLLFSQVLNGEDFFETKTRDFLFRNRYLLSPGVTPDRFSEDELHRILTGKLESLSVSSGFLEKQFFQRDPTGEFISALGSWEQKPNLKKQHGVWFSEKSKKAFLVAEISASGFNLNQFQAALDEIRKQFQKLGAGSSARLEIVGPPAYAVASRASIQKDIALLSSVATLLVVGILFVAYRSVTLVLLTLVPLASGILAGISLTSFMFNAIHGITLAFGVVIIGVAVDYPIHLFNHLRKDEEPLDSMKHIWPTLRLGVTTTAFGYFSMFFSGFDGLIQLAAFSVIGLVTAALTTRFVLPHLIPGQISVADRSPFTAVSNLLLRQTNGKAVVFIFLATALGVLAYQNKNIWEQDVAQLSPVPKRQIDLDKQARAELNLPDASVVGVIIGKDEQTVLEITENLSQKLSGLKNDGALDGFDSASIYLPSERTQRMRLKSIPPIQVLIDNLKTATEYLPFRAETFAPFIREITLAKNSTTLNSSNIAGTVLQSRVKNLLFQQGEDWYSMITFKGTVNKEKLNAAIAPFVKDGAFLVELRRTSNEMVSRYRDRALILFGVGFVVIVIFLFASLGDWGRVGRIVIPLASSVFTTAAILTAAGIKLSLFHLVALLLVVGLGLDYALFLTRRDNDNVSRTKTRHALVICNLSTLSVFGALSFSNTPVLGAIGSTVALGAILALLFSALFAGKVQPANGN